MRKLTQQEFEYEVSKSSPDVEIIGEYKGRHSPIQVRCKKCGVEWSPMVASLRNGCECPACRKGTNYGRTLTGINDVATTHPLLLKYFKNVEDAYTHCACSRSKTTLKCPICGSEIIREIQVFTKNGFICNICDPSISRPNKILRAILKSIPVDYYDFEYTPDWAGKYGYDGYFEYKGKSYVVEMDGGFHYRTGIGGYYSEDDLENTQKRDREKDRLAIEHGIIMIRIDCNNANSRYIMNSINNSLLGKLFDLSEINIDTIFTDDESKLKLICDTYNSLNRPTVRETSDILKLDKSSISMYLKRGTELGLCNFDGNANKRVTRKPVKLTDVKSGEVFYFDSHLDGINKIRETGAKADPNTFNKYLDTNIEYKGFICEAVTI